MICGWATRRAWLGAGAGTTAPGGMPSGRGIRLRNTRHRRGGAHHTCPPEPPPGSSTWSGRPSPAPRRAGPWAGCCSSRGRSGWSPCGSLSPGSCPRTSWPTSSPRADPRPTVSSRSTRSAPRGFSSPYRIEVYPASEDPCAMSLNGDADGPAGDHRLLGRRAGRPAAGARPRRPRVRQAGSAVQEPPVGGRSRGAGRRAVRAGSPAQTRLHRRRLADAASVLVVIFGPRPRRGTRWFWFWLAGGPFVGGRCPLRGRRAAPPAVTSSPAPCTPRCRRVGGAGSRASRSASCSRWSERA